jgi:hypothetical protein
MAGVGGLQVRLAATFDLLFSEQDRHGQNVFIDDNYNIVMIDNEGAFGPANSMFLPGTQKARARLRPCLRACVRFGYVCGCPGATMQLERRAPRRGSLDAVWVAAPHPSLAPPIAHP